MAVEASRSEGDPDYKNWVRHLPNVVRNLNRKFVSGTSFRRNAVDDGNFDQLLKEIYGEGFAAFRNSSSISDASIGSDAWRRKIFRFHRGQKVRVNRKSLGQKGTFTKASVEGGYSRETFVVSERSLRSAGQLYMVPGRP